MPRPRVFVKATFVSTTAGKAPSVCIESPINISEHVGVIGLKWYEQLKNKLGNIVRDTEQNLFFHRGKKHIYHFFSNPRCRMVGCMVCSKGVLIITLQK